MKKLILTAKFTRAFRKYVQRDQRIKIQVQRALDLMEKDVFTPQLNTHQLKGEFVGFYACSCGYDCRIIFTIEKGQDPAEEIIILVNIGTHNEVY
jgi:mRNA interferase YafQ